MTLENKKEKLIIWTEYMLIFVVISLAFFFMIPQSDVFLFARATQGDFSSVLQHALYYGNGRLLGNIIGMFFSNWFNYAFLVVALGLVCLVVLINTLIFSNNKYMIFPIAILVAFPSSNMMGETYYLFASFCNFVLPCVFILLSICLLQKVLNNTEKKWRRVFLNTALCMSGMISCLFSENTTAVVVALAVLQLIYTFLCRENIRLSQWIYLISTFIGAFFMLAVPRITASSQKMQHYRGFEISLSRVVANFAKFSEVICNLTIVVAIVSIALIYLCIKKTNINSKIKALMISFFIVFDIASIVLSDFEFEDLYISRVNFASMFLVSVYLIFAVGVIINITEKALRFKLIFLGVLLASSIAPMMIVTQYGYRTYYITMIVLIVFSLYVLKPVLLNSDIMCRLIKSKEIITSSTYCSAAIFVFLGMFCFAQTVYNFDFYVVRTNMIREQIEENRGAGSDDFIEVFTLPCEGISIEDEAVNLVFDIIGGGRPDKMKTVGICDSLSSDEVLEVLESNFLTNLKYAFEHVEYKNPLILSGH